MGWVKRLADGVIQDRMGQADLEFAWSDTPALDPKEQADILQAYVKEGIKTRNEARALLGDAPLPGGDALTVDTPQGPLKLADAPRPAPIVKAFNPDEPRDWHGRWTDAGTGTEPNGSRAVSDEKLQLQIVQAQTCQEFIAENCVASINREFPGQFLRVPVDEVLNAAKAGDPAARGAKKLLFDNRYRK